MHPSLSPSLLFIPSIVFFIFVTVCYSSDWFFLIISSSLLRSSLCASILFPSSVTIHTTNAFNFLSSKLFIFVSLVAISEIFSCHFNWDKLLCLFILTFHVSLWNSMEKLPMVGLKRYLYMGASLYHLHGSTDFDSRAGFDLNTSHVFPQGVLSAIILLGGGVRDEGPEPGVSQGFSSAQWPSQSYLGYGWVPSC